MAAAETGVVECKAEYALHLVPVVDIGIPGSVTIVFPALLTEVHSASQLPDT